MKYRLTDEFIASEDFPFKYEGVATQYEALKMTDIVSELRNAIKDANALESSVLAVGKLQAALMKAIAEIEQLRGMVGVVSKGQTFDEICSGLKPGSNLRDPLIDG